MDATKRNTARRGNGEGCIYQRPDGRWVASLSLSYDANGKRKRRVLYGRTKKEVQEKLTKAQSASLAGLLASPTRDTVAAFLARWLQDVARVTVRKTTFYNYSRIVANHISPRIGGVKLQKLTPAHVQHLYSEMERDGAGPHVRRLAHAVLRRALKTALRQGVVVLNVCDSVEPPRIVKREMVCLDTAAAGKLLHAAQGNRLEALYHLALGSGMRMGELFGLNWSDLDLSAGTVTVVRTLTEVDGKLELTEPKTRKSRRPISLPPLTVAALAEHRRRQMAAGHIGAGFVFTNLSGGPLRRSHFHAESYKPLLEKAGLENIRFHDLRHSHASQLLAAGIHPKVVQERLGHSQISITLDTYSHVLPGMQEDAASRVGDALDAAILAAQAETGHTAVTLVG